MASTCFFSGQLADDAKHRRVALGDIVDETRATMELLQGVLADLGLDFGDVVKVNVYMTDLDQFHRMNEIYAGYFPSGRFPARTTVGVARASCSAATSRSIASHACGSRSVGSVGQA